LSQNPNFEQVSPEVGELDESAFDSLMNDDPDAALALLAELVGATDPKLRALARALAGRVFVDIGRRGARVRRGIGTMVERPLTDGGDIDIDASLDALTEAHGGRRGVDVERLRTRTWAKKTMAMCLLVDRSGSMGGRPLAVSALAAAAVAGRQPDDYSVVAFGADAVVAKAQDHDRPVDRVVGDVLSLRGFGTTDISGALVVAAQQLTRSAAARKVVVLLSDCRHTAEGDPTATARMLDELVVVAPAADCDEATAFAQRIGARLQTVSGPSDVPRAINAALAAR
jgi:Mg-chelatase subunit ChlD